MDKHDLSRIFNEMGILLEIQGENPFKSRAYYNAARILENLSEDLNKLIADDRLGDIPGFGPAIVSKIKEWVHSGTIEAYENLKTATPPGLLQMLRIPGVGPKKIHQLHQALGITSLEALEAACQANRLVALAGFGVKTQEKIQAGIQFIKEHRGQFLWYEAYPIAVSIRNLLLSHDAVLRADLAGSIRRFKETINDLDLVAAASTPKSVMDYFINLPEVQQIIAHGDTMGSVIWRPGIQVDVRVVKPEEYPHALQHFTGSKEHNTALRHLAKGLGYKVNEYGLFQEEKPAYCRDEAEIYQRLGLAYIPPELREDLGELEAAREAKLPQLIESRDLKGLFHVHTSESDGANTLEEMVVAAIERGYSYLGIADHSQAAAYARGLTKERVLRQAAAIEQLNQKYSAFKIFKGIEADILPDGGLDYSPDILAGFDYVIGSIHSQFRMGKTEMTQRILQAMDDPRLTMLGHPTGRILLERPGYELDLDQILAKAAERKIILEFNANPYRLDLDWRWLKRAKEMGILIAINPDAHSVGEYDLIPSGLQVARKGWLEVKDVFNAMTREEVELFFKK